MNVNNEIWSRKRGNAGEGKEGRDGQGGRGRGEK